MTKNLRYKYMKCAWVCFSASICLYGLKHIPALWSFPKEKHIHHMCAVRDRTDMGRIGIIKGEEDWGVQAGGGSTEAGDCNDGGGKECICGWVETIRGKRGRSSSRHIMNCHVTVPKSTPSWARFTVASSPRPRISDLINFSTDRSLFPINFSHRRGWGDKPLFRSPTCTQSGSMTHTLSTNGPLWVD